MKRVVFVGQVGVGKSDIIGNILEKTILSFEPGYINFGKDYANVLTPYPVTIMHGKNMKLTKYNGDENIETYEGMSRTKYVLKTMKREKSNKQNIHFILNVPLKKCYRKSVITDGLFHDSDWRYAMDYLEYVSNTTNPIFKIDALIYTATYLRGSTKMLSEDNVQALKDLETITEKYGIKVNCLYNAYKMIPGSDNMEENARKFNMLKSDYIKELSGKNINIGRRIEFYYNHRVY